VFQGKTMDITKGACTGAAGTLSETGWSNGEVFRHYLEHHFLPFARPTPGSNQPILLIYDSHTSGKSPETIKWAREHGIVLFVLPAHSSHLLKSLDVAFLAPSKSITIANVHSTCQDTWVRTSRNTTYVHLLAGLTLKH